MNKIISAVLFICICIGGSILGFWEMQKRIDSLVLIMEEDKTKTLEELKSDKNRTDIIVQKWLNYEKFFASVLGNNEIQKIEIGIKNLRDYQKEGLADEYIKTLNNCINELKHITDTEKIHYKNVL